jgi:osmotically-inducible protein OsmY
MIASDLINRPTATAALADSFLDATIAEQAETRLRGSSRVALKSISCEFRDGVLTLRGSLPTYYLKQIAQEVVAATERVERVENQIEVSS